MRRRSARGMLYEGNCKRRAECRSERMRGGKFVILVYLASDDSESSQRIGMLDNRLKKKKKKKSMGARRRKKSDDDHTASEDPWVPRWLPVLGNRQRHSDVGEETKEKVQQKCGGAKCGVR